MEEVYEQGEAPSAARIAAESGLSSLLVLFSSQTGNAAAAACDVWREVQRQLPLKEQPILLPFGAVWRRLLGFAQKQKATKDRPARVVVVLVVATAGESQGLHVVCEVLPNAGQAASSHSSLSLADCVLRLRRSARRLEGRVGGVAQDGF